MTFTKENQKERYRFIDQWADYVRTHSDQDWSAQQNVIINSCLRTASMTKEQYLAMKNIEGEMKQGKNVKKTHSERSSEVSKKSLRANIL
ncbi:MAG: hypothetical protein NTX92_03940 [Euryarchaeota archaeon]|nr:hypothetical protein [Euryarchaeota archaeon]